MDLFSIMPDAQLAATLLKAFGRSYDVDNALEVFERTTSDWELPLNEYHYNALIHTFARVGDWDSAITVYKCALRQRCACLGRRVCAGPGCCCF